MGEAGLPGYDTSTWGGILAPKGTPKDVITKLNVGINKALTDPEASKKLADVGISFPVVSRKCWANTSKLKQSGGLRSLRRPGHHRR